MKLIIILSTVFSLCCCFSDLSPSFGFPYGTSEWRFHPLKQKLLNNKVTDEEILRCQYFMDKISEELDLISSQEELQDILSQCDLLLQKGIKYQTRKDNSIKRLPSFENNNYQDYDNIKKLPPFDYNNYQKYEFITIEDSPTTSSVAENNQNTGPYDDPSPLLVTEQYETRPIKKQTDEPENPSRINTNWSLWSYLPGASESSGSSNSVLVPEKNDASKTEKKTDEPENPSPINANWSFWNYFSSASESSGSSKPVFVPEQNGASKTEKKTDEPENPSPINTNWSFWNYFSESSGSSSSVPVAEQSDASKTEKQPEESEVEKTRYGAIIPDSIDTSLWNFFYGFRNSNDSSKENLSGENFGKDQIAELGIDFGNSPYLGPTTTEISTLWNIIMPGTKWCGSGSVAMNDDDLGYFEDVDRCCRAHDKCNDLMVPGESKHNLKNTSPFSVLNCQCDDQMHDCLRQINSVAANAVGQTYFNIFGRMCYTLDYPRKCKTYNLLMGCQEFEVDTTAEKVYQWKPAKKYPTMTFI